VWYEGGVLCVTDHCLSERGEEAGDRFVHFLVFLNGDKGDMSQHIKPSRLPTKQDKGYSGTRRRKR
jgi:hypothetical protein